MAKKIIGIALVLISASYCCSLSYAQSIPVEEMVGNLNYQYQHILFRKFSQQSKIGFFNVHTLYSYYNSTRPNEIMSQSYVTYSLNNWMILSLGSFYASQPGFTPSAAVQFIKKTDRLFVLLVPRADLKNNPNFDFMVMTEYRPKIMGNIGLYLRAQLMSNYSSTSHNRSYQNFRLGADFGRVQTGLAINYDEYGKEMYTFVNAGVFLRTEF